MTYTSYSESVPRRTTTATRSRSTGGSPGPESRCWRSSAPKTRSTTRARRSPPTQRVPGAMTGLIPGRATPRTSREPETDGAPGGRIRLFPGTKCRKACRMQNAVRAPALTYEPMFDSKTTLSSTADRCRRPADRFRHARRVRARAGRESSAASCERAARRAQPEPQPRSRGTEHGRRSRAVRS